MGLEQMLKILKHFKSFSPEKRLVVILFKVLNLKFIMSACANGNITATTTETF